MSKDAMQWVASLPPNCTLDPYARAVLYQYAWHADQERGEAYQSISKIAARTSLHERTVASRVKRLRDAGLLVDTGRRINNIVVYRVPWVDVDGDESPIPNGGLESIACGKPPTASTPLEVAAEDASPPLAIIKPPTPSPQAPHWECPQTDEQNEQKEKTNPRARRAPSRSTSTETVELPAWLPVDAWDGFVEMRRQGKHPLTAYAERLALRDLAKLHDAGEDPRAVLEKAVLYGWRGLFPVNGSGVRQPVPTNGHPAPPRSGLMAGLRERRQQREAVVDVDASLVLDDKPAA
ncbi:hypothetical protein LMG23992_02114 [Cupriavidus laharis]|uniref:Helix-turn-helix domain-containing protein n=1 Tax=Cupriavidus laharis TaxID=151654 RepID=A0ABM8WX27_9BURK|nr:helix-turn-helix domain-containing protein [Cupriavidus laharis]CAG9172082.1 hypothetical protein LMG23992_02114 [Cupriavidus laharis]